MHYGENMANMPNMPHVDDTAYMPNMPHTPTMTSPYGYEPCYYGYGYPVAPVTGGNNHCGFALIVVLFILLIIIGATCYCK